MFARPPSYQQIPKDLEDEQAFPDPQGVDQINPEIYQFKPLEIDNNDLCGNSFEGTENNLLLQLQSLDDSLKRKGLLLYKVWMMTKLIYGIARIVLLLTSPFPFEERVKFLEAFLEVIGSLLILSAMKQKSLKQANFGVLIFAFPLCVMAIMKTTELTAAIPMLKIFVMVFTIVFLHVFMIVLHLLLNVYGALKIKFILKQREEVQRKIHSKIHP